MARHRHGSRQPRGGGVGARAGQARRHALRLGIPSRRLRLHAAARGQPLSRFAAAHRRPRRPAPDRNPSRSKPKRRHGGAGSWRRRIPHSWWMDSDCITRASPSPTMPTWGPGWNIIAKWRAPRTPSFISGGREGVGRRSWVRPCAARTIRSSDITATAPGASVQESDAPLVAGRFAGPDTSRWLTWRSLEEKQGAAKHEGGLIILRSREGWVAPSVFERGPIWRGDLVAFDCALMSNLHVAATGLEAHQERNLVACHFGVLDFERTSLRACRRSGQLRAVLLEVERDGHDASHAGSKRRYKGRQEYHPTFRRMCRSLPWDQSRRRG